MALATFDDLPPELVEIVVGYVSELPHADVCSARLLCRTLHDALDAVFYRVLALDGALLAGARARGVMVLAERVEMWAMHATVLRVCRPKGRVRSIDVGARSGEGRRDRAVREEAAMGAVMALLDGLTRVDTVEWELHAADPFWLPDAVQSLLNRLRTVTTLHLRVHSLAPNQRLNFSCVTRLTTLTFRGSPAATPELAKFLAAVIECNLQLTSLTVHAAADFGAHLWSAFRPGVFRTGLLTHLCTSAPSADLLHLLHTHPALALHVLHLHDASPGEGWSNGLADVFFTHVLPRHAPTLADLAFGSAHVSIWAVMPHLPPFLAAAHMCMPRLRRLAVTLNPRNVLPELASAVDPPAIPTLLALVASTTHFPALQTLVVRGTYPDALRPATCGPQRAAHAARMRAAIRAGLADFGLLPVPAPGPGTDEDTEAGDGLLVEVPENEPEEEERENGAGPVRYLLPRAP